MVVMMESDSRSPLPAPDLFWLRELLLSKQSEKLHLGRRGRGRRAGRCSVLLLSFRFRVLKAEKYRRFGHSFSSQHDDDRRYR